MRLLKKLTASLIIAMLLVPIFSTPIAAQNSYEATIKAWRDKREQELRSDTGWLTVTGLFWLQEGANSVGSAPANHILLPATALAKVGAFIFRNGKTVLRVEKGVTVLVNDKPVTETELKFGGKDQKPDIVTLGDLSLQVIKRGGRYGVRLKDKNSRERREFTGLRWFPVAESYRLTATYVAYPQPKEIEIVNILGQVEKMASPGYVTFTLNGKEHRLEPVTEEQQLFFIFRDLTSNKTTYPAGRFLYSDLPQNGKVILDFNQAINPPCAFTEFATCPLPPPQNWLKVAIEAGELAYHTEKAAKNRQD